MTELNLIRDDGQKVSFSKLRKAYFYFLAKSVNDRNDLTFTAERTEGYCTVARYDGAEIALGVAKFEKRYRVYDIPSGMIISTLDDIQICKSIAAVEKLLPTIIERYIKFMCSRSGALKRYLDNYQPRMACEIAIANVEPEYKCYYNQYSTLMVDYFKEELLDGGF